MILKIILDREVELFQLMDKIDFSNTKNHLNNYLGGYLVFCIISVFTTL